jgi:preprotein translocase subunit SecE
MNRQAKRMMQKQKATSDDRREAMMQRQRATVERKRRTRTAPREFLKQVRAELKKVAWPSRQELVGYTIVVLVAVVVLTSVVFGLDITFSKVVLRLVNVG